VKIVRVGELFQCHLSKGEWALLSEILKLYPCIPPRPLSGAAGGPDSSHNLLEEYLAEQRVENKERLRKFFTAGGRFEATDKGLNLSISITELEWLLQILNDIRVGSWMLLGSPDEKLEWESLEQPTARHFWAMETAGHFQMQILFALKD
jgi:hypothetical protein